MPKRDRAITWSEAEGRRSSSPIPLLEAQGAWPHAARGVRDKQDHKGVPRAQAEISLETDARRHGYGSVF